MLAARRAGRRAGRRPPGVPTTRALRPTRSVVAGLTALVLIALGACAAPQRIDGDDVPAAASSAGGAGADGGAVPGSSPLTGAPAAGPPATASGDGAAEGTTPSDAACVDDIGAQLRERTTITATGLVTVLGGSLPCRSVGVWAGRFTLDSDPTLDPPPQFGAAYTGARQLAVRLPATSGRCTASAVFFTVDGDAATDRAAAVGAATRVRADLAGWPAGSTAVVPGGGILRGRASSVLAATVVGDPSACSPGESVSTPFAAEGDCWAALPDDPTSTATTGTAQGATRFRRTLCGEAHTHEVYWAEGLTPAQYVGEGRPAGLGAAAWARRRAGEVCAVRGRDLDLTHDVFRSDVFLEYLWPATLAYPPSGAIGWSKAQVVCLVRWKDGRASDRHLLHR